MRPLILLTVSALLLGASGCTKNQPEVPAPPAAQSLTPAEQGRVVFQSKGCISCHSTDGTIKVGPSLKGVFESKVELSDGTTIVADEAYIRESIEKPQAKIVKGFAPVMPSFKNLLNQQEFDALVAYIKSLK
jgi:cytochrome c oxidase subunit 2